MSEETQKEEASKPSEVVGLEVKEEGGKKLYRCPNCGEWVDHFDWYGNIRSPMCPNCKKLVKRDLVPPDAIQWKPARKTSRKKAEEDEKLSMAKREYELKLIARELGEEVGEGVVSELEEEASRAMEEYRRYESESIFEAPKPPEKILFEVLSAYKHINPEFIRAMVRRAKRKGYMTPDELKFFLMNLKSGVKGPVEAQFIADEYAYALQREAEKAKKLGYPYPYSATFDSRQPYSTTTSSGWQTTSTYPYTSSQSTYPYTSSTYPYSSSYQTQQSSVSGGVTREELERMMNQLRQETQQTIQQALQQILQKKKEEELEDKLHALEMKQLEIQQQMINMMKSMKEEFMQMMQQIASQASQPPPNVVTRDEMEKMFMEKYMSLLEKQIESKDEAIRQWQQTVLNLNEKLKELKDENERLKLELMKELEMIKKREPIVYKPEGYKEDAFRLLAESVHHLAEVVKERKPIETTIKTLAPALTGQLPQQEKPKLKETKRSKSKVFEYLEGTEYVVEE